MVPKLPASGLLVAQQKGKGHGIISSLAPSLPLLLNCLQTLSENLFLDQSVCLQSQMEPLGCILGLSFITCDECSRSPGAGGAKGKAERV